MLIEPCYSIHSISPLMSVGLLSVSIHHVYKFEGRSQLRADLLSYPFQTRKNSSIIFNKIYPMPGPSPPDYFLSLPAQSSTRRPPRRLSFTFATKNVGTSAPALSFCVNTIKELELYPGPHGHGFQFLFNPCTPRKNVNIIV